MRRLTIAGLIAALTLGTFVVVASVLVASAQTRPNCILNPKTDPCWPAIGARVLQEWFSDLPWTQKLVLIGATKSIKPLCSLCRAATTKRNLLYEFDGSAAPTPNRSGRPNLGSTLHD
jgi:hypothetical protein